MFVNFFIALVSGMITALLTNNAFAGGFVSFTVVFILETDRIQKELE